MDKEKNRGCCIRNLPIILFVFFFFFDTQNGIFNTLCKIFNIFFQYFFPTHIFTFTKMVRTVGLESTSLSAKDFKSSEFTNFSTPAYYLYRLFLCVCQRSNHHFLSQIRCLYRGPLIKHLYFIALFDLYFRIYDFTPYFLANNAIFFASIFLMGIG